MGLSVDEPHSASREDSGPASPSETTSQSNTRLFSKDRDFEFLLQFTVEEIIRLLDLYQDEVESVYPFISSKDLALNAGRIISHVKQLYSGHRTGPSDAPSIEVDQKDIQLLTLVIATAIVIETHGKNELSTRMIDAVEGDVLKISRDAPIQLKDLQMVTTLVC
jgi:hypothetical protein